MADEPRRYLHRIQTGKKYVPRNTNRSTRIVPTGTAAEVGRELRNMIRVIDTKIIGATKTWHDSMKRSVVEARLILGHSPREEAEALGVLIAVVGLHIIDVDRWRFKTFSRELIPALQSAREVLGMGVDDRFEGIEGTLP